MFKKKQPEQPQAKPSKFKIQMKLDRCKESIQVLLDQYTQTINQYQAKRLEYTQKGMLAEADRCREQMKSVVARQAKMYRLMDQVVQFGFMIDEAFAKSEVYQTFGGVLQEASKIAVMPEIKNLIKDLNQFEDVFTKGFNKMDTMFGKITHTVDDVNNSAMNAYDREQEAEIEAMMSNYDNQLSIADTKDLDFDF